MILTDKALEDFEKWLIENDYPISIWAFKEDKIHPVVVNALIIEWFDSVGIYININNLDLQKWFYYDIKYLSIITSFKLYRTRQQATEKAIIKANNIYNERYVN